nr:hypothetical protein [Angustibacter aerolatus]
MQRFCARWSVRLVLTAVAAAVVCLGFPALLAVLVRTGADAVTEVPASGLVGGAVAPAVVSQASAVTAAVGGGSAITVAVAVLLRLRARLTEPDHVLQTAGTLRTYWQKASSGVRRAFVFVAATVAGPLLLGAGLVLAMYLTVRSPSAPRGVALVAAGALAVYALVYFFGDLTSWSMHPFYRRRLCSAFALKRVRSDPADPASPDGDRARLRPARAAVADGAGARAAARRLRGGEHLQQRRHRTRPRRHEPSPSSRSRLGGPLVGYVGTEPVRGGGRQPGARLHAAGRGRDVGRRGVAVDGQDDAPAPDVPAGAGQRAPRRVGAEPALGGAVVDHEQRPAAAAAVAACGASLLGMNALNGKFLFVSDGGHYENLGLVEPAAARLHRGVLLRRQRRLARGDGLARRRHRAGPHRAWAWRSPSTRARLRRTPRPGWPSTTSSPGRSPTPTRDGGAARPAVLRPHRAHRPGALGPALHQAQRPAVPQPLDRRPGSTPTSASRRTASLGWCAGRRAAALQTAARQAAAPQVAVPQAAPVVAGGAALDGVPQQVVDLDGAAAEADVLDGAARPVDA